VLPAHVANYQRELDAKPQENRERRGRLGVASVGGLLRGACDSMKEPEGATSRGRPIPFGWNAGCLGSRLRQPTRSGVLGAGYFLSPSSEPQCRSASARIIASLDLGIGGTLRSGLEGLISRPSPSSS